MNKKFLHLALVGLLATTYIHTGVRVFMRDIKVFTQSFIANRKQIGAIAPCSPYVGAELVRYIAKDTAPKRILEVGAGTGVLTYEIIEKMRKHGDYLDVIEIDPELCKILQEKFKDHKNVTVHCISIIDWKPQYKYDYIISSLPFNSFSESFVKSILDHYVHIIKPQGILSYVEYIGLPKINKRFLKTAEAVEDFEKLQKMLTKFRKKYAIKTVNIFLNVPPIHVHHLRIEKNLAAC